MKNKSIVSEGREIALAVNLIQLGARLQLLEAETHLSRERLLKLYKEVKGVSPPKGMLPFSTDWFMTWQPNIHASLFMSFFSFFKQNTGLNQLDCIVKAFKLYQEHVQTHDMEEVHLLRRPLRGACLRPEGQLCLRPVQHSRTRRQDAPCPRGADRRLIRFLSPV
jgi:flagellar transcriptional activator FlhC